MQYYDRARRQHSPAASLFSPTGKADVRVRDEKGKESTLLEWQEDISKTPQRQESVKKQEEAKQAEQEKQAKQAEQEAAKRRLTFNGPRCILLQKDLESMPREKHVKLLVINATVTPATIRRAIKQLHRARRGSEHDGAATGDASGEQEREELAHAEEERLASLSRKVLPHSAPQ